MQKAGTITAIVFSAVMLPALALSQNTGSGNSRDHGQTRDSREQMRFRAMDTDNDGVITRDEWQGNAQSFREHDLNHDGVLSGEEVRPRVVDDRADRSRREEMAARFERADRNGDGRIARSEWTGTTAAFKRLDENGDGIVTRPEYFDFVQDGAVGTAGTGIPQNTTRAYRAGYDRGVIEGRDAGKADKGVDGGHWDLEGQRELEQADSGYTPETGARADYQQGYRTGFRSGYREGFGPQNNIRQTNTRAYRTGYDRGLIEGRQAGKEDKGVNGGRWDLEGQRELEQADSGYTPELGARTEYQDGYRAGFRNGYREGFGPRR
jgi:Ca2+-binding EF-hand superfamily protein